MGGMREMIEGYITSSNHLAKKHVHPRLMKMFEMGAMGTVFTRAEGPYLYDTEGQRYLDMLAGGGVFFLGRNHPHIKEALADLVSMDLPNLCIVNASILGGLVAEKLIAIAGDHYGKVVFGNSGTEATDLSLRFARKVTGRRRFVYLQGAFHGRTYASISVCGFEQMKEGMEPLMPQCTPVRPNDIGALRKELEKGDVAAFIFEPVQGMTLTDLDPAYLREAERLCRTYGTLVIADEIQTGLGRMGGHWFAVNGIGIKPDLMTVSKTLSGGYAPVGALLISEEVYSGVYNNFKAGPIYFSTFAENNLAMGASLATLQALEAMDAPKRAQELSDQIRLGLRELMKRYDCIDRIAGRGLMMGLYFKDSEKISLKLQQALVGAVDKGSFAAAFNVDMYAKKHVVLQIPGPDINAIKFLPPVILSDDDVQYFLGALDDTFATFYGKGGPVISLGKALAKDAVKGRRKKKVPANGAGAVHLDADEKKKSTDREVSS